MSTPLSLDARLRNASYALEAAPALPAGEGQLVPMLVSERIQLIIDLREAADALTGRLVPQAWQPIETCLEGVDVFCYFPTFSQEYQVMVCHRLGADWYQQDADNCPDALEDEPTAWMALPPPPLRPGEPI